MAKTKLSAKSKTASPMPSKTKAPPKSGKPGAPPAATATREVEVLDPEHLSDDESLDPLDTSGFAANFDPSLLEDVGQTEIDPDRDIDPSEIIIAKKVTAEVVDRPKTKSLKSKSFSRSDSKELATTDPITTYLSEIRKYPLLTREQEQELATRYRETGDPKAAELLVTSNLRFVVKVAAEYSRFGAKLIDLIQEGNVGLMHAVKEFNPYKGVRLITYAVWWIRGYIQEYLMRQYSMVRIGTTQNQRKLFYRLQKEKDALDNAGIEPNVALLAGRLGVTEDEVVTMTKRMSGRDVSLNTPIDGDNSAASLLDFEASPDQLADDQIGKLEELQVLRENIDKIRAGLSAKESFILEKRILSDEPMTLQEIGDHYKVTREAIRQIEARLIGKIRVAVTASLFHEDPSGDEKA
jgi:RNA polymerase sigma-32 factor